MAQGMMERRDIVSGAATWMQARGWKEKLAKRREHEQSLFEQSLIEPDVLLDELARQPRSLSRGRARDARLPVLQSDEPGARNSVHAYGTVACRRTRFAEL